VTPPAEIAPGIWRWTARHPEWHPGEFGAEVASFALHTGDDLLLIDPQLPEDDAPVLEWLDGLANDSAVHALITIGYHVRSAEALCERYGGRIYGPHTCAKRLTNEKLLTEFTPGTPGPAGSSAFAIGKPRRTERPLWLPSHNALAFGDAIVTTPENELRVWSNTPLDAKVRRFYRERFAPTLEPLLELPVEHVLVTHGEPIVGSGARALREAAGAEPWYHHG
jgi:glyoxylase-like metal-dependent hydrolase (beta-lactamase superfamily II)